MLEDVIEACGGLKDGMVTVQRSTADGFMNGLYSQIEEDLAEGAMLAWAQNGEPLSPEEGAPLRYVVPGWPAYSWTKYLTQIDFIGEERPDKTGWNDWYTGFPPEGSDIYNQICDPLDSAFWTPSKDGQTYKLGDTMCGRRSATSTTPRQCASAPTTATAGLISKFLPISMETNGCISRQSGRLRSPACTCCR